MPMMFFYFLKIIFDISTSKRSKKYKPHLILAKQKIQNLTKHSCKRNAKHTLRPLAKFFAFFYHRAGCLKQFDPFQKKKLKKTKTKK